MQHNRGISVVIPCYNREEYLKECIQSVLDQEGSFPVEIIIADDGSTDDSIKVIQNFKNTTDSQIRFLEKPVDCKTQGAAPTRNRGVAAAQYSYIAFLDSDDLFLPGHLNRLFHFLEQHNKFAGAVDQLCGFETNIENRWIMPYPDTNIAKLESFFLSPYFNPSAAMIRHSVIDELEGPFEETLRFAQDIDFFFRILEKHQIAILSDAGAALREHGMRSTGGKSPYLQYKYAEMAFNRAIARHPYPSKLKRKRKAAIQFRLAQGDLLERKYLSAAKRLLHAFWLDPIRAIQTLLTWKIK